MAIYWVKTFNYLLVTKGWFSSKDDLRKHVAEVKERTIQYNKRVEKDEPRKAPTNITPTSIELEKSIIIITVDRTKCENYLELFKD